MRANAKEAITHQGDRMRRYAQDRAQGKNKPPPKVGTLVRVKVDKVDRGKLNHKSVPGVVCEVTEHGNYRIVCKGGVLKDCLMAQHFQLEEIKKPENYDLQNALENWQGAKRISICEALRVISLLGGQGFFFCNCKGNCKKNGCKCRKNGRQCNSKCHPCSTVCENHS
jgi:hypothetical protein